MPRKLRYYGGGECSEAFVLAFICEGSITADCVACGRTHFSHQDPSFYNGGEYEKLLEKQKANPECYIGHNESISYGWIFGKQVVAGCPCGFAALAEKVLWGDRYKALNYFLARAKEEKEAADEMAAVAEKVAEAVG